MTLETKIVIGIAIGTLIGNLFGWWVGRSVAARIERTRENSERKLPPEVRPFIRRGSK